MIVASDFHGDETKVDKFLAYRPNERHVYCGDILDSFTKNGEEQLRCLNKLIESKSILLWGNHENNYRKNRQPCSGYQWQWASVFQNTLEGNKQRFRNAYLADGYICTHAGIGQEFEEFDDPLLQVREFNREGNKGEYNGIYAVGYSRGGNVPQGGIFWFDHNHDGKLSTKYNQVFGHTAGNEPVEYSGEGYHHVCINTRDGSDRVWVFNTSTKQVEEIT